MSTVSNNDELNLKLWNAAKDGDNDAVITAIVEGADVNWTHDSLVSDIDNHDYSIDSRSHHSSYHMSLRCTIIVHNKKYTK